MKPTYCKHAMPLDMYCPHCEIEKLKEQLQQAHRAGWEQAKREAVNTCHKHRSDSDIGGEYIVDSVGRIIAAMEYKEPTNV